MSEPFKTIHSDLDREYRIEEALTRYSFLKNFKQSELNLDDQLFIGNFEAAMIDIWEVHFPQFLTRSCR